jgi:hypothetical protein
MGIDGIGKPGAGAQTELGSVGGSTPVGEAEAFRLEGGPNVSEPLSGSEALGQLQRGEITVEEYLEGRLEQAVSPLAQQLSGEQLQFVREMLRDQLTHDPVLVELVRRTTT